MEVYRDTAGCSWCVCVLSEVLCLEEGVIEGGMEGTGVTEGGRATGTAMESRQTLLRHQKA